MSLYNMTQHGLQPQQMAQAIGMGYKFIEDEFLDNYKKILSNLSGEEDLQTISICLALYARDNKITLLFPIGSPLFYMVFASYAKQYHVGLLFSHTRREAIEKVQPDGSIVKTMVFNHVGYHHYKNGEITYFPLQ